jgi:putative Mg2+ transporter-C (MgtC) family protein
LSPELEMVLRLLLAVVLGGIVGWERQMAKKPAGLRTHLLVCIGATLFTLASIYGFEGGDPSRVAAGIVAGIGFLGAGTIIRSGEGILIGLTTASSIWAIAAIGMVAGAGLYILSAVGTAVMLIALRIFKRFE